MIFFGDGLLKSFGPVVPVEWPPRHLGYAFGAALTLYGLVAAEEEGTLRIPTPLLVLGAASYSIYLTQSNTILILEYLLRPYARILQPEITFIAIVAVALLPGLFFSRYVELPLLRLLRRKPSLAIPTRASVR